MRIESGSISLEAVPARRRAIALTIAISIHAVAFVALFLSSTRGVSAPGPTIATFDASQPGPVAAEEPKKRQPVEVPPQPVEPVVVPVVFIPSENEDVAALLQQAAAGSTGGSCDLTEPVQAALRLNPLMGDQLATISEERLSVANALAIWRDIWTEADDELPEPALAVIRETVRDTVLAASDDCRYQTQVGPRLIYLPQQTDTVTLALGSGEWTWQQVADTADPTLIFPEASVASEEWTLLTQAPRLIRAVFDGSERSKTKARPIEERPRLNPQKQRIEK